MMNDFRLPLVGLATSYCEFSKEDPEAGIRQLHGGLRRLLSTELAMARCEFGKLKGYYETLDMTDPLYLAGVTNCVVGALGRGDLRLFDRILRDLRRYPEVNSHPAARLGQEITEAWIRQFLRVRKGYPEWMTRINLTQIPEEWKRTCAYLGVKGLLRRQNYDSAYAAATMLLNFDRQRDVLAALPTYERLVCAHACHELGRKEEAFYWLRRTAEMTCPHGIILPYLILSVRVGPVMEDAIREVSPEAVAQVRRLAPQFFANLIRFRNHFTGEKVTTVLTPREFYIALELCDGHSYKDLAEKLDLSASRIGKQVQTIFSKLGINRKDQLAKFVW